MDVARKSDCGLIVMGTHGRRGLPRALLGSVAEKIVCLSPSPVLTFHASKEEGPAVSTSTARESK